MAAQMSVGNETGLSAEIFARGTNTPGAGAAPASEGYSSVARVNDPTYLPTLLRVTRPLRESDMLQAE